MPSDNEGSNPAVGHLEHLIHQSQFPYSLLAMVTFNPQAELVTQEPTTYLPNDIQENFIDIFLSNRAKCCFEIHTERFFASLRTVSPSDLGSPHPCLIEAILLLGCYFSRFASSTLPLEYEEQLLSGARQQLLCSYEEKDRLHDFVRASNLVAFYYLFKGFCSEANEQLKASIAVLSSCGLHRIRSSVWSQVSTGGRYALPHSRDRIEHGERILTFWQTFCLDKIVSQAFDNVPPQLVDGTEYRITTPWPRLLREYEHGDVTDMEVSTVSDLLDGPYAQAQYTRHETLDGFHAQGLALVTRAAWAAGMPTDEPLVSSLDKSIQEFSAKLPGIRNSGETGEISTQLSGSAVNPHLIYLNTLPHIASLYIHQYGANGISRQKSASAIQSLADLINELGPDDYKELFIGAGYLWNNACEILIRILHAIGSIPHPSTELFRNSHVVLVNGLRRFRDIYPALEPHIALEIR